MSEIYYSLSKWIGRPPITIRPWHPPANPPPCIPTVIIKGGGQATTIPCPPRSEPWPWPYDNQNQNPIIPFDPNSWVFPGVNTVSAKDCPPGIITTGCNSIPNTGGTIDWPENNTPFCPGPKTRGFMMSATTGETSFTEQCSCAEPGSSIDVAKIAAALALFKTFFKGAAKNAAKTRLAKELLDAQNLLNKWKAGVRIAKEMEQNALAAWKIAKSELAGVTKRLETIDKYFLDINTRRLYGDVVTICDDLPVDLFNPRGTCRIKIIGKNLAENKPPLKSPEEARRVLKPLIEEKGSLLGKKKQLEQTKDKLKQDGEKYRQEYADAQKNIDELESKITNLKGILENIDNILSLPEDVASALIIAFLPGLNFFVEKFCGGGTRLNDQCECIPIGSGSYTSWINVDTNILGQYDVIETL